MTLLHLALAFTGVLDELCSIRRPHHAFVQFFKIQQRICKFACLKLVWHLPYVTGSDAKTFDGDPILSSEKVPAQH